MAAVVDSVAPWGGAPFAASAAFAADALVAVPRSVATPAGATRDDVAGAADAALDAAARSAVFADVDDASLSGTCVSYFDDPALRTIAIASPTHVRAVAQSGDLRAIDLLRAQLEASDAGTRSAALVALAQLGDMRVIEAAAKAFGEKDARLRSAAGH